MKNNKDALSRTNDIINYQLDNGINHISYAIATKLYNYIRDSGDLVDAINKAFNENSISLADKEQFISIIKQSFDEISLEIT